MSTQVHVSEAAGDIPHLQAVAGPSLNTAFCGVLSKLCSQVYTHHNKLCVTKT